MQRSLGAWLMAGLLLAGCGLPAGRPDGGLGPGTGNGDAAPDLALRAEFVVELAPALPGMGTAYRRWLQLHRGVKSVQVVDLDRTTLVLRWTESRPVAGAGDPSPETGDPTAGSGAPGETVELSGALRVAAPGSGERPATLVAPGLWPVDTELNRMDTSAIWLSAHAFTELMQSGRTAWDAGLFDSLFASALAVADNVREAYERMTGALTAERLDDLRYLQADPEPVDFPVQINGRRTTVKAVHAHNWFVDLYVLNRPDNPLVLQATFNPVSDGPLDLFSPLGLVKALLGYRVTAIRTPRASPA